MATTIKLYPFADGTIGHTKSSSNSAGYALINETTNNTTGYLSHTFSTTSTTKTSIVNKLQPNSSVTINNKIRINSINSVNYYLMTSTSNASLSGFRLNGTVTIGSKSFTSNNFTSSSTNASAQTLNISNGSINEIYESFLSANISLEIRSVGAYSSSGGKSSEAYVRIYNANITVSYDNVFDCKTEVLAGVGITSATPTAQEVVEGDSCTFTAVVSDNWVFDGWYANSDFSGTPESTSATYTKTNITGDVILYPKAVIKYHVNVFGNSDKFSYTLNKSLATPGESITLTVTLSNNIYTFVGIYLADSSGNKTSTLLSSSTTYTFTMPDGDINLYVEVGKEVKVYVDCLNCSLVGNTSPITFISNSTGTITLTYNSSVNDWSGIYSDSHYTNRLTNSLNYTFQLSENDLYLYAKAIPKQQIYIKENGSWVAYSKVYVKENGVWVEKDDFSNIFDISKNYKRINL